MRTMRNVLVGLLTAVFMFTACTETIDVSDRYTYSDLTIINYLEKNEQFTEYLDLLGLVKVSKRTESSLKQLLSARGHYTVFAPNNVAIAKYLDQLVERGVISEPSWDAFDDQKKLDSIRKVIVFNSIIDGSDQSGDLSSFPTYSTSEFPDPNDEFAKPNMNDRKLTVTYGATPSDIFINGTCEVHPVNRDKSLLNGYVHEMNDVIAPSNETLADILNGYLDGGKEGFMVTAMLIRACQLSDTLSKVKDEVYEELIDTKQLENLVPLGTEAGSVPGYMPEHRKYGFTLFAETDDFWRNAIGKDPASITLDDIRKYISDNNLCPGAVDDTNYKSEDNAVNQFITYHILPMRIPKNKLVIHYSESGYYYQNSTAYTIPVWEFYTTMGKRRLLKIYGDASSNEKIYLNRFPNLDNGRHGDYHEVSCDPDKEGVMLDMPIDMSELSPLNGIIYPINRVLAYTNETRENFQKNRIRFDITSCFPEFMNNDLRPDLVGTPKTKHTGIPITEKYTYIDGVTVGKNSNFYYLSGRGESWANYQGDELNVTGKYELTFRLPPVPRAGTYEIRYLVGAGSSVRSMCQVYFGTNLEDLPAQGIPLDLRMGGQYRHLPSSAGGNQPSIAGWEEDVADDDDYNAEVDKLMRANGFMKGPHYYDLPYYGRAKTARECEFTTRRIIVTREMSPDEVYYIRFKNVLDDDQKQFYMDFLEFCAKEVYDNPYEPEDIW